MTILTAAEIASMIGNPNHDVFIRESISLDVEIDFPDEVFVNDKSDHDSVRHPYGWRTWENPSQQDLTNDIKLPNNLWEPIFGDYVPVNLISAKYLQKIENYQNQKLETNYGLTIEKYKSQWSDYTQLKDIFIDRIFDGNAESRNFEINVNDSVLDKNRVFAYINGILQPSSNITIIKKTIGFNAAVEIPIGSKLVVIYRKYQPTTEDLKFNPDERDDIQVNTQFSYGYDFTENNIRDQYGKIAETKYYFWVKNKNTPIKNHNMSVQQVKNLLTYGPSLYMNFHNLQEATGNLPLRYDAITLSGVNKFVGSDDTYKVRFTRNFTLRDDPQDLDLKNVHSEWTLLRPAQNVRIPQNLWEKMVNSACGQDIVGNVMPRQNLADYDARHGTSNRFGLGAGQVLAEKEQTINSIKYTILNTQLTINIGETPATDYIRFLDLTQLDKYFDTPDNIRKTLDKIWREAKPKQINEIFFAVINDALANNFEFADVFKTSRLSVYSIKTIAQIITGTSDE